MKSLGRLAASAVALASMLGAGAADHYSAYIERYAAIAMEHHSLYGIPASITLAQGLLESAAGRSPLAVEGNNHFGIKCHKDWKGGTMKRNDDAPGECFRTYATPEESFADHSRFLKRDRYKKLFDLPATDYQGWARGLRECGYATDPHYAARLITIIERYALYSYDSEGDAPDASLADYIRDMLAKTHPVRRSRGLHYVVALPGDTYSSIAREFNMKPDRLMRFNDASRDAEIKPWEEVYLEEKLDDPPEGVESAVIGDGESMHSVAQRYGIRLSRVRGLNAGVADVPGSRLRLR